MEICIDEFSPESTDELNHEYEIIERIGSGAFGTVMHAVETSTNRECAIKVINKSGKKQSSIQKMKQEINHLEEKNRTLETNNKEKQLLKNNQIDKIFLSTLIEKITLTRDKKINIYYRVNCNF